MSDKVMIYQSADGKASLEVRLEQESVWLNQKQLAELFDRERSVMTRHINNVFREGELEKKSNVQNIHIANSDKPVTFYNLEDGSKRLADNALVALTLLIAESKPEEKDTIVKVIVSLINRCN